MKFTLIFFCLFIILFSCGKKSSVQKGPQVSENELKEFRPNYPETKTQIPIAEKEKVAVTPTQHQNAELEAKLSQVYEKNKNIKVVQGFRIQVYSGNDRLLAEKAQKTILELYPDSKPEIIFFQPNFKVKVGDFYDRSEAQLMYNKLKNYLPQALVVPEKVKIK